MNLILFVNHKRNYYSKKKRSIFEITKILKNLITSTYELKFGTRRNNFAIININE